MKKFAVGFTLVLLLLTGVWAASAASANFSGTWVLDKSKSEGLPPQWQNLESYTMVVSQDNKQLTVENKIVGAARPMGDQGSSEQGTARGNGDGTGSGRGNGGFGRQGRGGRGGGFGMGMPAATYKLDGTETKIESTGRGGGATLKAELQSDGNVLLLTNTRTFNFQGNEATRTTRERWELGDGGKTLTVKRSMDTPQGTRESTLVFNKQ